MIKGDILECWIDGKLNLTFDNHYVQRQYVIPGLDRKNKEVIVKVINAEAVPMPMTLNIRNGELKLAFETEKFEMMNIKNCMLSACAGMLGLAAGCVSEPDGEIKVDFARKGADIPASMYGIFFEEINHSGDGGLYAELRILRSPRDSGWKTTGFIPLLFVIISRATSRVKKCVTAGRQSVFRAGNWNR